MHCETTMLLYERELTLHCFLFFKTIYEFSFLIQESCPAVLQSTTYLIIQA
jgi:hypothetical protein